MMMLDDERDDDDDDDDDDESNYDCYDDQWYLWWLGPFDKYGSLLVKSCAIQGTHYCDITGETDWVVIIQYQWWLTVVV